MRKIFLYSIGFMIAGCSTFGSYPGYYTVKAYDAYGNRLDNVNIFSDGSRVHSTMNSLCRAFPSAKLIIKGAKTKKELSGVSPHYCKGKSTAPEAISNFTGPKEINFIGITYRLASKNEDKERKIYEYTTKNEKISDWNKLITLSNIKTDKNSEPSQAIKRIKLIFGDKVNDSFIFDGHGYMNVVFSPDKKHPYYEGTVYKTFHDKNCMGELIFSYAKKYPASELLSTIVNENASVLAQMKVDNWSPNCTK